MQVDHNAAGRGGPSSPVAVMQRIADESVELIAAAEGATVEVVSDDLLVYACCSGSLVPAIGTRVKRDASLSGLALQTFSTLHCEDAFNDPRVDLEASIAVGLRSMVCVPLRDRGVPVGVLKVGSSKANAFSHEDVSILTGLAEFLSATLTLAAAVSVARAQVYDGGHGTSPPESERASQLARFMANVTRPGLADDIDAERRIRQVIDSEDFSLVFQPVVSLDSLDLVGAEALARFHPGPYRSPDLWFAEAARIGLGVELELAAARKALDSLPQLPRQVKLGVNFGPDAVTDPRLAELIAARDPARIVLELTEHSAVENYARMRSSLMELRQSGVELALDDVGTGFSNLTHIINFAPDIIKMDIELVRGIDIDPVRRSLARALVSLAEETGAEVVAEGVEREEERLALIDLGVPAGQGYLIGRPGPVTALANPIILGDDRNRMSPGKKPT